MVPTDADADADDPSHEPTAHPQPPDTDTDTAQSPDPSGAIISDDLHQTLEAAEAAGWTVSRIVDPRSAIIKKHDFGTPTGHVLVLLVSGWVALAVGNPLFFVVGNLVYATVRYFFGREKRFIRAETGPPRDWKDG